VLVKDNLDTADRMLTTTGSSAPVGSGWHLILRPNLERAYTVEAGIQAAKARRPPQFLASAKL
jgi:hypothetical protein